MAPLLVVGAGPAGAAVVLGWLAAGRPPPLWVDPGPAGPPPVGEALPPDVPPLLAALGASDALAEARPARGVVSIWGSPEPAYADFLLAGTGGGRVVDRPRFDRALRASARRAGATLTIDPLVGLAARPGGGFDWRLASGASGVAAQVVDASGRAAAAARRLGICRHRVDRLVATLARLPLVGQVDRVHIEAGTDHWWYLGPLPGGEAVVAVFADADLADWRDRDRWRAGLAATGMVGGLVDAGADFELRVVSAGSGALDAAAVPGFVAVGDAACAFDPLSSAGIGKALASARRALPVLLGARDAADYSDAEALGFERYLDQRRAFYAEVRRFDHPFWRRRARPLRLDPAQVLAPGPRPAAVRDVALGPREWRALWAEARSRPAVEWLRALGPGDGARARRRVEAIEALVAQGALVAERTAGAHRCQPS
ncbi:MAG: tryptophan 7-halogenase [bacterium]